jgi:hypothetical protein
MSNFLSPAFVPVLFWHQSMENPKFHMQNIDKAHYLFSLMRVFLYQTINKTDMGRILVLTSLIIFFQQALSSQTVYELPSSVAYLYPTLEDMHGYAVGKYQDYYLIFGGSINSDVPELYPRGFPNLDILLIDVQQSRAAAYTSASLEGSLAEQMNATGLSYYQQDNILYLLGGYGFSESNDKFITFPYITAIDLQATVTALQNGENPVASFYQLCDERLAIFDGVFDYNGDQFFIINGKTAYKLRPFAEDAEYIEQSLNGEAKTFKLSGKGINIELKDFQSWYDMQEFQDYFGPLLPDRIHDAVGPIRLPEQ